MKALLRTVLAFAAGAGLILLLLLVTRKAPSNPPEPLSGSAAADKTSGGEAAAGHPAPPASALAPAPPRTLAGVDTGGQSLADSASTTRMPATPASSRPGGAITGLGGRFQAKPGSKMRIEGTSNIHDWQVEGRIIIGNLEVGANFPFDPTKATPGQVDAKATVTIPVRSLKSVKKDGTPYDAKMDEIMYEKLLEPANKAIKFVLSELVVKEAAKAASDPAGFEARGDLTVAGKSKSITMPVKMTVLPDDKLMFSGTVATKMTDFGIQPPEPLGLGIKTGDDVKLIFDWVVGRTKP